ncbi:MAG: ABC transporter permease [Acidimicrobiales bacterium]|nr:ABC transporter permease [Acidimicrobiales bacterium]MCB9393174.1 ABC transporter permease [Acidimicrobiaceae bacterium]
MTARRQLTPVVAAIPLVIVAVFAAASNWLAPDARVQDILTGVTPPGTAGHLFGTDTNGRDIAQLAIAGARTAVVGPVVIALGSMCIGLVLGTVAGYLGGAVDLALSKYADLLLALPTTLIALVVAGLVDGGYWVTVAVLVVLFSPTDIRMVRGAVISQSTRPYVESAKALGLGRVRIMFRHIVPNVLPVAFTTMLLNVAFALVAVSALSFLGLGVGPGEPDWGRQLSDARDLLGRNWAAAVVPGVLIIVTAAAINLLGDWAQERFERRGSGR